MGGKHGSAPTASPRGRDIVDGSLSERIRRGESVAFDEIVAVHQTPIRRLVFRLLGWSDDVDDVVQEVFLSAMKGLKRFQGRSTVGTWLGAIAVNKCRSHWRRKALRHRLLTMGRHRRPAEEALACDRQSEQNETRSRIRQAVRALPRSLGEVVVLRYLQEMPIARIAEVTSLSPNAVQTRLHRGRKRLAEILADLMEA